MTSKDQGLPIHRKKEKGRYVNLIIKLGVDYFKVEKKIEDKIYRLNIWDVSGSELEDKVLPKYLFKSVDAFVLTFSLDNVYSLNSLKSWIKLTEKKNLILLKNKSDIKKLNNETVSIFKNEVLKNEVVFEKEFELNIKNFPVIRKLFYSLYEKFSDKVLIQKGSFGLKDTLLKIRDGKTKTCC